MGLIFGKASIKSFFISQWAKYVPAIILYGEKNKKKNMSKYLEFLDDGELTVLHSFHLCYSIIMIYIDDTSKQLVALRILAECLGKGGQSLCYLYEEYEVDMICVLNRLYLEILFHRQWRVYKVCVQSYLPDSNLALQLSLVTEGTAEYFIICEQKVLCQVAGPLSVALFTMFSAFFVFNLDYPSVARSIFNFFQDFVVKHPDGSKKTGNYLSTISDINRHL